MIVRARVVATMAGQPIKNGAVRVQGKRITEVGKISDLAGTDKIVDLSDHILLPGLINAHCHLDYTCLRGRIPPPQSFAAWIRAINAEKANLSAKDYLESINRGFAEAKHFGTTTIANLTAFPELIPHVRELIHTWWFAELIDVRQRQHRENSTDYGIGNFVGESLRATDCRGLAPHAPFTASANLYKWSVDIAERADLALTTHLAESREEMQMFRDASGPLYEFLNKIGRDMSDCGGTTPLQAFVRIFQPLEGDASLRAGSARSFGMTRPWLIAHLNELSKSDFDLLAKIPQKLSIAYCPRSHGYFGHSDFQFEALQKLGFNVCLGTDSLASNHDLSLFAEMRKFHDRFRLDPQKILEMVTINAARALKQHRQLGKIQENFLADMIALPFTNRTNIFESVLNFVGQVPWIMLHGKISS